LRDAVKNQIYTAHFRGRPYIGTVDKIIKFLEGKGYEAQREEDYSAMHEAWQAADHWKRMR
jgi:hypothetical protein